MGKIMLVTAAMPIENILLTGVSELMNTAYYDIQAWIIPKDCSPQEFRKQIHEAEADLYIVGSSMANTLSSLVAAHTAKPVLGVPISGNNEDTNNEILNTKGLPTGMPYRISAVNDFADIVDTTKKLLI